MSAAENNVLAGDIAALLEQLQQLYGQKQQTQADHQAACTGLMSQALQRRLAALEATFATQQMGLDASITQLQQAIKTATLAYGKSVSSTTLSAIYSPGRVTWEARALSGYAIDHPELLQFCKTGEPYITIRAK